MVSKFTARISLFLAGLLILAGCSATSDPQQSSTAATTQSEQQSTIEDATTSTDDGDIPGMINGKFDPPVTMRLVLGTDEPFRQGEDYQDNVLTRWALERLGIKMDYLWESASRDNAYVNKVRLEMAAGNPMPDVLYLPNSELLFATDLINSGMFRETGTLFDKYAGEKWKAGMEGQPNAWTPYIVNGERMGVPVLEHSMLQEVVMLIRTDWLQKLNMDIPTNITELESVFDAFTNQDPDGDGKNNTYGVAMSLKDGFRNAAADAGWVFGMHGVLNGYWGDWNDDGRLEYGSVMPGAKDALAVMSGWMSNGYIHQEAGIWDYNKAIEQFAAGNAGTIFLARYNSSSAIKVVENVPGATWEAAMIPVGPNGTVMRHGSSSTHGVWLINKDWDTPEAFFVYQDYLMSHYADPDKGDEFELGLFEGYDYIIKDGQVSTNGKDFPENAPRIRPYKHSLDSNGARMPGVRLETYYRLYNDLPLDRPIYEQLAAGANPEDIAVGAITLMQQDIRRENMFTGAATETMRSKGEFIDKMELEVFHKILYGEQSVDTFDKFVQEWNSLGGEKITQEVNELYDSVRTLN